MRGSDRTTGSLFSYVDIEARIPAQHPLRLVRRIVNDVLLSLDAEFAALYEPTGRESIPPQRLLRGSLLQAFYSIRSERQLMEQLDYNLLYRWFVGLGIDHPYGTTRPTRRTATACWKRISPGSSSRASWSTRRSSRCCRTTTSRSTAR